MSNESEPDSSADLPELTEALDKIAGIVSIRFDLFSNAFHKVLEVLRPILDEALQEHERQMAPFRKAIEQMGVQHVAATKVHDQVLNTLLARGWCHSYHFTDALIVHLGQLISAGKGDQIDEIMAEFTRRESDRIRTTACEKFPARAAIITDAFEAHRDGKYTLSVPALLNQLDGIGCEVMGLGRYFFSEKKRADALAKIVAEFKWPEGGQYHLSGTDERMLLALERAWGMTQDTNSRTPGVVNSPLNRHGVVHGLDTDYPTEFNSLRCILKLGFTLEVRRTLHEDIPRHLRELERIVNDDVS